MGQLVYLASLRDPTTGQYRHLGLEARVGVEAADEAIRSSHERLFRDWLRIGVEERKDDLEDHFRASMKDVALGAKNWLESAWYMSLVPSNASRAEREDFRLQAEIVLEWIRNAGSVEGGPGRGA